MADRSSPPLRWIVEGTADPARALALANSLRLPIPLAALLVQRGIDSEIAARRFLRPALQELADPHTLAGMDQAVFRITEAVRSGTRIMVHGDYDVDGQCGTAMLTRVLRAAGADVLPFLPHRLRDGYDLGSAGVAAAREAGVRLIITCDCGITAVAAVEQARAAGIDVIISDHHLPGPELPAAVAIINPQRPDDQSNLKQLCGTGVAFKLVQALVPALGLSVNLPYHLLDLVAMATIADIVPLIGENRIMVRHGLKLISETRWVGLRALVRVAGLEGREIRSGQVGFVLGPRLNAAGRVGDAQDGLRLLLTDDEAEADNLAHRLEGLNVQRQALDQRILEEAIAQVEREVDAEHTPAFVLAAEGWHPGVVGIVASRVVERYGRPTFLVAFEGDIGKGSGRSISRFDLHAALQRCGDLLDRYGGHHMAAGVTLRRDRLEAFRERFISVARESLAPEDLGPEQRVDLVLELSEVSADLERLCRHLEPCGMGNPAPVFGVRGVSLNGARRVGGSHLRGTLAHSSVRLPAIGFQWADRVPWVVQAPGIPPVVDVAFRLEQHTYMGETGLQARLMALAPSLGAAPVEVQVPQVAGES